MMNRSLLVGRLTADPELKYTPSGAAVCTFTLAVNRTFTNQAGEREADFINIVVWKRAAENAANFLKKGSLCGVDGRLQSRRYTDRNERTVYVTEVVAESVQFLEPKGNGSNPSQNSNSGQSGSKAQQYKDNAKRNSQYQRVDDDPFGGNGETVDISDDDLPF
jgi:single-strand DNA-binding protein